MDTGALAAQFNEGMTAFADQAAGMIQQGTATEEPNLETLGEGLREAVDAAAVLEHAIDSGLPINWPVVASVERLVQATLTAYPHLQRTLLESAAGKQTLPPELRSLVDALDGRCHHATTALLRSLEAAYRALTDAEQES